MRIEPADIPMISPNIKRQFLIVSLASFVFLAIVSAAVPFSPSHDSYDMFDMLGRLINGTGFTPYTGTYYNFYAANKLALYLYFLPCKVLSGFSGLMTAVRIVNFIFMWLTCLLSARTAGSLFGESLKTPALIIGLVIYPFMVLTGPYVYPLSMFLSAMAIFLYTKDGPVYKGLMIPAAGLLIMVRMTAFIPVLCFMFFDALKSRRLKVFIQAAALILGCLAFREGLGFVLYKTGLHPFPRFENASLVWTLDIGTRPETAGQSGYTPYHPIKNDPIALKMGKLWDMYGEAGTGYSELTVLQKEITQDILERTKKAFPDPELLAEKINSLFGDVYRPYYYEYNVRSKNAAGEVRADMHGLFFLDMNMLLVLFAVSAAAFIIYCIIRIVRGCGLTAGFLHYTSFIVSALAVAVVFILFTEVSKKYMLDAYLPMSLAVSSGLAYVYNKLEPGRMRITVTSVFAVFALTAFITAFKVKENPLFKDAVIRSEAFGDGVRVEMTFKDSERVKDYNLVSDDGETIPLEKENIFELGKWEQIYITSPDSQPIIFISRLLD